MEIITTKDRKDFSDVFLKDMPWALKDFERFISSDDVINTTRNPEKP